MERRLIADLHAFSAALATKRRLDWLAASVGTSPYCSVCGDSPCRAIEIDGTVFEEFPEEVNLRAALVAASGMVAPQK